MKNSRELLNPAMIAALLLFASATIMTPAKADDQVVFDTSEMSSGRIEEASREQAREANETAVQEAAEAIAADAKLELDIKLIGRTSVLIAGDV
jgi:hypothetical protein